MQAISAKPEPNKQTKEQPDAKKPLQMEIDFTEKYQKVAKREIEKDLESLMKLLDKFACTPPVMNQIISIVQTNSLRLKAHKEPNK